MSKPKKRKRAKYKVVIIGAGRIASQFDSPQNKEILTHAHAYYKHPDIDLLGFFDIDKNKSIQAAGTWRAHSYSDFEEISRARPDIISICTPDEQHYADLIQSFKLDPKIIICEKPITTNLRDTKKLIAQSEKYQIPILVNYRRRFEETVQNLKRQINLGTYGKIICASGIYSGGMMHNGSHLIDLARYLFGEVKKISTAYAVNDSAQNNKSVAGFLQFEKCPQFNLMVGDARKFFIFELDIIFEKKRFRFVDEGLILKIQSLRPDPIFKGYTILGKEKTIKTSLDHALMNMLDNALGYLERKNPLASDLFNAYKTQKVCFSILENKTI